MIDVQKQFGRLQPNTRKKGIRTSEAGRNLYSVAEAAAKVDPSSPSSAANVEGFTDIEGRRVKFSEE